ncbi:thioredoxin family protein [Streptococcus halichoeri]|uniref:thioredoxin family protein n=1 Tax=Streptococcus halichoeri TaxID=254785 RepID=UPI0013590FA9|nr:thioredoxin family protein [Streptococcus halichoeri]
MQVPASYEALAQIIDSGSKCVLFFTADWCPDCQFIAPLMPAIEQDHPNLNFVEVNRDSFLDLAKKWDIYGIPSFVVIADGRELGRLVNKKRKTKAEVSAFLAQFNEEMKEEK